jgi:hypothetical protein
VSKGHRDHQQENTRQEATQAVSEAPLDEVEQAIAKLPKAKQAAPGDDFTGGRNSQVVNMPKDSEGNDLLWVVFPRDIPGKQQEYEDAGYVLASSQKFGVNPQTKKPELLRSRGPMPGHIMMVCDPSIRRAQQANDAARRQALKPAVVKESDQVTRNEKGEVEGVLEAPDISVTRPG